MRLKVIAISLLLGLLLCLAAIGVSSAQISPSFGVTDPAIKEMLASLDMPRISATATNAAGNWHLELSNGPFIELALLQSGAMIFGKASVNSGISSHWATASGDISGNVLRLNIVPENGTELYAVTINLDRLPLSGTYVKFRGDAAPTPGMVRASWLAA